MANEVSVFIMNVSDSANEGIGNELSEYLQQLEVSISYWTQFIVPAKITHRAGDELVFVGSGYASAYMLAFYISRIWKFTDYKPNFGLSFGDIQEDISSLTIETWIHPLIKKAREANNYLKKQQLRNQFHFKLPHSPDGDGFEIYNKQFEMLLNTNLTLMQEQMNDQTEIQSLVCSLYLILTRQNKVSKYLGRTTSTVSTHMKNGKTDIILNAFVNIVNVLNSLGKEQANHQTNELQITIRQNVTQRLQDYFPIERKS